LDEFIASAPKALQPRLKELRATIKSVAPEAEEKISYGMPDYHYKGRVIYFNVWKTHIGLYALPTNIEEHKSQLKGYATSKGTIQLPLDQKLPLSLIKKLVQVQVKKNEAAAQKK